MSYNDPHDPMLNGNLSFVPQHDGPIKSIHWIKAPNYSCIMTGSWDKTLKVRLYLRINARGGTVQAGLSASVIVAMDTGFVYNKW